MTFPNDSSSGREQSLLNRLLPRLSQLNLLPGNEDAVAWLTPSDGEVTVCNIDMIAWSTDALPATMSLEEFGRKLVAVTVSDLASKGATPKFFVASAALPPSMTEEQTQKLLEGLVKGCEECHLAYLGGDLGSAEELVMTGVAIGTTTAKGLVKRSGARSGDLVCVTGPFGLNGLGYAALLDQSITLPEESKVSQLVHKQLLYPQPRLEWGPLVRQYARASLDSSDGLAVSLHHLAKASNLAVTLENLPTHPAVEEFCQTNNLDPLPYVCHAGEEFELVFTLPPEQLQPLQEEARKHKLTPPVVIGRMHDFREVRVNNQTTRPATPLPAKGWDALAGFDR